MRYYLSNNLRFPEYETDLCQKRFFRVHRIAFTGLLSLLLCFYLVMIVNSIDRTTQIVGSIIFLPLIGTVICGFCKIQKEAQVTFRFHEGVVQNITYSGVFSVDTQAAHYISLITLFYRNRAGDIIRPCYVFSGKPISKLLGDCTGDSIHEFNRAGMILLPQSEEMDAWILERYHLDPVPEFPEDHFSAPVSDGSSVQEAM